MCTVEDYRLLAMEAPGDSVVLGNLIKWGFLVLFCFLFVFVRFFFQEKELGYFQSLLSIH